MATLTLNPITLMPTASGLTTRLLPIGQLFTARRGDILHDSYDNSYWRLEDDSGRRPKTRQLNAVGIMRPTPNGADLEELDSQHTLNHEEAAAELRNRRYHTAIDTMTAGEPIVYLLLARRMPVERLALDDELAATGR